LAAGFVAFFAATCLTPSFGAGLALEAVFGANGTADFELCEVVATLALADLAFALAGTTLDLVEDALLLAATTLGFVDDALLLTATTLGFDGAVLAFV